MNHEMMVGLRGLFSVYGVLFVVLNIFIVFLAHKKKNQNCSHELIQKRAYQLGFLILCAFCIFCDRIPGFQYLADPQFYVYSFMCFSIMAVVIYFIWNSLYLHESFKAFYFVIAAMIEISMISMIVLGFINQEYFHTEGRYQGMLSGKNSLLIMLCIVLFLITVNILLKKLAVSIASAQAAKKVDI